MIKKKYGSSYKNKHCKIRKNSSKTIDSFEIQLNIGDLLN